MSKDANHADTRRRWRLISGFVLGAAMTAIVMGFLWSSDSARQEERIRELSAEISEKDATIGTLYSQLSAKGGSETPNQPPAGENP